MPLRDCARYWFLPRILALLFVSAAISEAVSAQTDELDQVRNLLLVSEATSVARDLSVSNDMFDQIAAVAVLADVGDKAAIEFLAAGLESTDFLYQRAVVDTLLSLRSADGVEVLRRYMEAAEDLGFLRYLMESLASHPLPAMISFLIEALDHYDPVVKKFALQSLSQLHFENHDSRIHLLENDAEEIVQVRAYAWNVLLDSPHRRESIERLLEMSRLGSPEAKEVVAVALGRVDTPRTREALVELMSSNDERVALAALTSSAGLRDEAAARELEWTIVYGDGLHRAAAASGLKRIDPVVASRVTENLMSCYLLGPFTGMRLVEAWAMIDADPSTVYGWGLSHEDEGVRMQSIWLIGQRRDVEYLERVAIFLRDPSPAIRGLAAWAVLRLARGP